MSGILPTISIKDVPENKAPKISASGVIGEVTTKEVANGYVSVAVPITYLDDKTGDEKTFTARYNVKPEWFDADYAKEVFPTLEDNEKTSYQINMVRNTQGLFSAAGLEEIDFGLLEGQRVGFSAGPQKNDPSRLELKAFFKPRN